MSKVLIIESEKVLQQALSLALFPEHEVTIYNRLPETGADGLKGFDCLIIDATTLGDAEALNSTTTQVIERSGLPTLWLDEPDFPHALKRDKLTVLKKPIEKDALDSAIAGLLSSREFSNRGTEIKAAKAPGRALKERGISEQESFHFIDLVDVVEEGSKPDKHKKNPRKP